MKDPITIERELFARLAYAADELVTHIESGEDDPESRWRAITDAEKAFVEAKAELDKCTACNGIGKRKEVK